MKYSLLSLILVAGTMAAAQDLSNPNLQAMVDAERAFIKMAKETNTRDAFLSFLSEHAVTFGKEPRIGLKHFESEVPNSSWLKWTPEYCDISASGDFGYNTGPWELRTERGDANPSSEGHFVTIWTKHHDGSWKAALDIGVSHGEYPDSVALTTSSIKPKKVRKGDFHTVTEVEEKFIESYDEIGNQAYKETASEEMRMYRTGKLPLTSTPVINEFLKSENSDIDFEIRGGSISKSKDLAYVYGTVTIKTSKDGHIQSSTGNYLRIWKKEDGNHWKIVVDVLSQG